MLNWINDILWKWMLPFALLATAILCGIEMKFKPIRSFHRIIIDAVRAMRSKEFFPSSKSLSQKQMFSTALAASLGTGNLIGTAAALLTGGAGAIFWMWISAFVGMILVYAENLLSSRFRRKCVASDMGGALLYLPDPRLSAVFAAACAAAGIFMGSMAQASAIAVSAAEFSVPPVVSTVATCLLCALILSGDAGKIGAVSSRVVPMICLMYFVGCGVILARYFGSIPAVFARIFREAFGFRSITGGFCASALISSIGIGFRRGIFSNEAGLGSSGLLHMHGDASDDEMQANSSVLEVFFDTVVCCTLTALTILSVPSHHLDFSDSASLLLSAFTCGLGRFAAPFLAICMILLAFATMIGWYPCGAAAFRFLFPHSDLYYLAFYILAGVIACRIDANLIFPLCDFCNACMALPNLYGLCAMRKHLKTTYHREERTFL